MVSKINTENLGEVITETDETKLVKVEIQNGNSQGNEETEQKTESELRKELQQNIRLAIATGKAFTKNKIPEKYFVPWEEFGESFPLLLHSDDLESITDILQPESKIFCRLAIGGGFVSTILATLALIKQEKEKQEKEEDESK